MKTLYKILSSSKLALTLLLTFAIAMAAATFVENDYGTATAWSVIYDSWWFELVMIGLSVSFLMNIFKYNLLQKEKWAVLTFHISFIIIIIGAGITRYSSNSGIMRIREGQSTDVIVSDTQFFTATISDGKTKKVEKKKLKFSSIQNNDFKIETKFNNKPITIAYKKFIPDAIAQVVEDSIEGKPMLEMVVTINKARQTIYLNKGETQNLSEDISVGFHTDKATVKIKEVNGQLKVNSEKELDFFIMASQQAGKIAKDSLANMGFRTLHRLGDVAFVPMQYYEKGKFEITSDTEKKSENNQAVDDAIIVDVFMGDRHKTVNMIYRDGFLPSHHLADFGDVNVILSYGSAGIKLPFKLKLNDFQLERYPGSSSPSAYASEVSILDDDKEIPYRIFMNNVLDYKGFRFFQASYDTDEQGTVLSVNQDRLGTYVTYLGYLLMGIGMFFTLFGKTSRFRYVNKQLKKVKKKQIIPLLFLFASTLGFSQEVKKEAELVPDEIFQILEIEPELSNQFGRLLVQDVDGRIKPINTLASELIRKITRKTHFVHPTAKGDVKYNVNQLFLSIHMYPNHWQKIPLIKVDISKLGKKLDAAKVGKNGLFSFKELIKANGDFRLQQYTEAANKKKPSERNEFDKEVLKIDERFNILYNLFSGSYLKIFPKKEDKTNRWFSFTHDFKDFNEEDGRFSKSIIQLFFLDIAERKHKQAYEKLSYIKTYQEHLAKDIIPSHQKIEAEIWYNQLNLNFWLFQVLFTVGFIMLVLTIIKMFKSSKIINFCWNFSVIITLLSFIVFTANIILRWYVSEHAPWSNGYEMLVFVAWVLLFSGLLTFRKSDFSLPLATLFTGTLLLVSYLDWINPEITNLMPVLKSYWLKIHVATIVSSYAPLALSAVLGFTTLVMMVFKTSKNHKILDLKIKELSYVNEIAMTIGLFLLSIGTFLGGVWANESWGRYWAWDPKETWALISIIIYAIVLHLRFIPKLNNTYVLSVASMFAFWSIIMTSFGVNYYLTGLHSYATGDPVPIPNFVYWVLGIMIFVTLCAIIRRKTLSTK